MRAPIAEFVRAYAEKNPLRLHMPGHKGQGSLCEEFDITEIPGADCLSSACGIIRESQKNASALFGAHTFYSTEGSSHAIRAMLFLALQGAKNRRVLAGRNAHKAFLSAAALLDFDVEWLSIGESYLSCPVTAEDAEAAILAHHPSILYLTSPDYLGNMLDLRAISAVCKRHGVLLLVDNAHGAYLKFLPQSLHPMDLGADMCCDSAHKTLPVLTGGAYLHIRDSALANSAENALSLFGTTSPSYLILQSLDRANPVLEHAPTVLSETVCAVKACKARLIDYGYHLIGDEPLKLTFDCTAFGYTGESFAALLERHNIICEFFDQNFVVLMLPIHLSKSDLARLETALCSVPKRVPIGIFAPKRTAPQRVCRIREAMFAPNEVVSIEQCVGRVLAAPSVSCPPAVPLAICGEQIDAQTAENFKLCGITSVCVMK